jgi:hypothetical protein
MSGTLQASVVKDGASATNNLAMDASGNVTVGNNLTVNGTSSHTGNATFSGTITGSSTLAVTGTITGSSTVAGATGILYPLVSGTAQASTSGTSIDFTGIPSWVKRITVMFNGVSTNGSSPVQFQLGTSGGPITSGYLGGTTAWSSTGTAGGNYTTGLSTYLASGESSAALRNGIAVFTLITGTTWAGVVNIYISNTTYGCTGCTSISLGAALTQVRITTVNGTDTFDAGSINILYE